MSHALTHNAYGKHHVRVSKIKRPPPTESSGGGDQHEFIEASVDVTLEGELESAYTHGDNAHIVATDTCKNTVYVLAKDDPFDTIESFGLTVAQHFLNQYDHLHRAAVTLREHRWHRLLDCPHAFAGSDGETPTATVVAERGMDPTVTAGLDHLMIAKTTQTGFENFHRDAFRTLPDTADRVFATVLDVSWNYSTAEVDFAQRRETIRGAMLAKFIDHYSKSVQETLYLMGQSALEACGEVASVTLSMPNKHHLKVDLSPFGRENENEVFMVTDEPYGFITGTVARS